MFDKLTDQVQIYLSEANDFEPVEEKITEQERGKISPENKITIYLF